MEQISNFHFLRPYWLLAVFPLLFLVWFMLRRSLLSRSWKAVCDARLLPYLLVNGDAKQSAWPLYLLTITALIAIIALAGPAWRELPQPVFRTQSALIIVLDMSQSMDATDIKPSRLARARHKILDILQKRREGQTALVVYALEAFVVSPLTDDTKTITSLVSSLGSELMPHQGSRPSLGVKKALELLQQAGASNGNILLVTDGIEETGKQEILDHLQGRGHRLSVLAVGTEAGAPIQLSRGGFLKDNSGAIVVPKFNEQPLRGLARQSDGRYARLTTSDSDIEHLVGLVDIMPVVEKEETGDERLNMQADQWREEGPWLLLLLIPFGALAFRRGWLAVVLLTVLIPLPDRSYALSWEELWNNKNQQGINAFEEGRHGQAAKLFKNKPWQAAAHYKAGEYEKALELLDSSTELEALYNKGNVLAKLGQLQDAIKTYEQVLEQAPEHEDAAYNKAMLEKYLQQQEEQESEQNDQQQNNQKKQDESGKESNQSNDGGEQQQSSAQQQEQSESQQNATADKEQQGDSENMQNTNSSTQQQDSDLQQAQMNEEEQQQPEKDGQSVSNTQQDQNADEQTQPQMQMTEGVEREQAETIRANEQWLRRIPDDPGGLLRRKFRYQSQVNPQQNSKDEKPW